MNYTNEEMELMESNVNFVSYKRTISVDYNSISREMSIEKPHDMALDKCEKYVRDRVNWLLQQDLYMLDRKKFNMTGYKK
jgi:hypothetical protein